MFKTKFKRYKVSENALFAEIYYLYGPLSHPGYDKLHPWSSKLGVGQKTNYLLM